MFTKLFRTGTTATSNWRRPSGSWSRRDGNAPKRPGTARMAPVYAEALTIALRGEEGGEISSYLSIMRDISERKLAEQKIE
jgi:PAS domain-containing protein